MCQIVGIPSHSRVELQWYKIPNYLYYMDGMKYMQWNTRARWQKYSLEKLSFKDGTGNEHLWTHVVFLRHLTLILKCYTFTKMVIECT